MPIILVQNYEHPSHDFCLYDRFFQPNSTDFIPLVMTLVLQNTVVILFLFLATCKVVFLILFCLFVLVIALPPTWSPSIGMDNISIVQASTTTLAASSAIWAALYSSVSARSASASCYKEKIMKDHMLGLFLPTKLLCCTFNIFLLLFQCNQYGFMCFKGCSLFKTYFFTWAEEIKLNLELFMIQFENVLSTLQQI